MEVCTKPNDYDGYSSIKVGRAMFGEKREDVTAGCCRSMLLNPDQHKLQILDLAKWRLTDRFLKALSVETKKKRAVKDKQEKQSNAIKPTGFTVVAVCCLLIEAFQSYRFGLRATQGLSNVERADTWTTRVLQSVRASAEIIEKFRKKSKPSLAVMLYGHFFESDPGLRILKINPGQFYYNIRCGLLHQGEVKLGWRVLQGSDSCKAVCRAGKPVLMTVYSIAFRNAVNDHVVNYLEELRIMKSDDWRFLAICRKLWYVCDHCEGTKELPDIYK